MLREPSVVALTLEGSVGPRITHHVTSTLSFVISMLQDVLIGHVFYDAIRSDQLYTHYYVVKLFVRGSTQAHLLA